MVAPLSSDGAVDVARIAARPEPDVLRKERRVVFIVMSLEKDLLSETLLVR